MEKRETGRLTAQIDAVIEQIAARLPADQAAVVSDFAARYFAQMDPDELEALPVTDLYGAVLSQWHFIARRKEASCVRVFNPRVDESGWECPHTVIEIVGEDRKSVV